jgi:hypothetical protein
MAPGGVRMIIESLPRAGLEETMLVSIIVS